MANTFSTGRLEAFSDGVIAVIITVMVLELKVPPDRGLAALRAIAIPMGVYALSFAFVGIYWINHHHLLHRIDQSNPGILRANLLWLFFLSLLPFFTAYVIDKHEDSFSVALYAGSLLATGFSFMILRLRINARQRKENRLEHEDSAMRHKHWVSMGIYVLAIPLAFFVPHVALCVMALITFVWIVPDFAAEHLHNHPSESLPSPHDPS